MTVKYSNRVEGAVAIQALKPGTLIASVTDGRGHDEDFRPPEAPGEGSAAAGIFPAVARVTSVSGRDADGPARLILSTGAAIELHAHAAVVTVSGAW